MRGFGRGLYPRGWGTADNWTQKSASKKTMTVLIKIRLAFKSYTSKRHNKSQIKLEGGNLHLGGGGLVRLVIVMGCIFLLSDKLAYRGGRRGLYTMVHDIEKCIALPFTLMKTCEFGHFISFLCRNDFKMFRKA